MEDGQITIAVLSMLKICSIALIDSNMISVFSNLTRKGF